MWKLSSRGVVAHVQVARDRQMSRFCDIKVTGLNRSAPACATQKTQLTTDLFTSFILRAPILSLYCISNTITGAVDRIWPNCVCAIMQHRLENALTLQDLKDEMVFKLPSRPQTLDFFSALVWGCFYVFLCALAMSEWTHKTVLQLANFTAVWRQKAISRSAFEFICWFLGWTEIFEWARRKWRVENNKYYRQLLACFPEVLHFHMSFLHLSHICDASGVPPLDDLK